MAGAWSTFGCQLALVPRRKLVIVRSGEEAGPFRGLVVAESWFIAINDVFFNVLNI